MSQYVYMQIEHKALSKKPSLMDFFAQKIGLDSRLFFYVDKHTCIDRNFGKNSHTLM